MGTNEFGGFHVIYYFALWTDLLTFFGMNRGTDTSSYRIASQNRKKEMKKKRKKAMEVKRKKRYTYIKRQKEKKNPDLREDVHHPLNVQTRSFLCSFS